MDSGGPGVAHMPDFGNLIFGIISFEKADIGIALEGKDVREYVVEEPSVVPDDHENEILRDHASNFD